MSEEIGVGGASLAHEVPPAHVGGRAATLLSLALWVNVVSTVYLSYRYLALHGGWVEAGTGICSWTAWVDCDAVLSTREARAFFVPNATLGLGFYAACLTWWVAGRARYGPAALPALTRVLALALGVATLMTFYFLFLMSTLEHLCPFCPWSHVFTWLAFGSALALRARLRRASAGHGVPLRRLLPLGAACLLFLPLLQVPWAVLFAQGALTP